MLFKQDFLSAIIKAPSAVQQHQAWLKSVHELSVHKCT